MVEYLKTKFEIIRELGSGGMADIYLARDKFSEELVAIKVLKPDKTFDIIAKERFKQEIQTIQEVYSPSIVKLIDYQWDDNIQYIVMEYVDGVTLREYINTKTSLLVDETVDLAKQMAQGFYEIHKAGIIHRDIKSQNIMVTANGIIKIIDFGIALTEETERVTKTGNIIASVQYVAPELLELCPPSAQTDIYAFGIILYEMLTGNVPFTGKTPEDTARKHGSHVVPDVNKSFPNIPQSLANIVIKATAKNPNHRYHSMLALYKDLNKCLSKEMLHVERINLEGKRKFDLVKFVASKKFLISMVIVIAFILVLAAIIIIVFEVM